MRDFYKLLDKNAGKVITAYSWSGGIWCVRLGGQRLLISILTFLSGGQRTLTNFDDFLVESLSTIIPLVGFILHKKPT